jgi:uncharacterized protein
MKLLMLLYLAYRVAISPAIGNVCRFEPTCSHYAEEAIERWGLFRGTLLAIRRILRCHPFGKAGLDPVPPRNKLAGERA